MIDYNIFDSWLDTNDVSDHTYELADAIGVTSTALKALLPAQASAKIDEALYSAIRAAFTGAYGAEAADEYIGKKAHLSAGEAFKAALPEVDNLNFEIGLFAHNLHLYAAAGIFQGEADRSDIAAQSREIEERVARGETIAALVPETSVKMDFFRLIVQGAVARWELDNNRAVSGDQIAVLSALARGEGNSSTVLYPKVRKTIQNLVADSIAKQGKGTFEVDDNRMIDAASALKWLSDHSPDYFPSMWMLPDNDDRQETDDLGEFVLVPVANPTRGSGPVPFTPAVRMPEGYTVGNAPEVFDDYWDALAYLQTVRSPRFRHPAVPPTLASPYCGENWTRIPLNQIEIEINDMNISSAPALEGKTAEVVAILDADSRFRPVAAGHSSKLHRYQSLRTGWAIAIERRKGDPVVYVTWSNGLKVEGLETRSRRIGPNPSGRNSNLNAIDNFKGTELMAFRPATSGELGPVLDMLCEAE